MKKYHAIYCGKLGYGLMFFDDKSNVLVFTGSTRKECDWIADKLNGTKPAPPSHD